MIPEEGAPPRTAAVRDAACFSAGVNPAGPAPWGRAELRGWGILPGTGGVSLEQARGAALCWCHCTLPPHLLGMQEPPASRELMGRQAGPAPQTGELLPAMASRDPPGAIPLPPLHPVQGWGGLNPTAQPTPCSNQPQHGGTLTASDSHNGSSSGEGGVKAPQCTAGKGDICISQAVLAQGVNGPQSQGT